MVWCVWCVPVCTCLATGIGMYFHQNRPIYNDILIVSVSKHGHTIFRSSC